MRLFSRGCESRQNAYLAVAGRLGVRDRLAVEAHAATCVECADALRNGRPVDTALRGAFGPLRERRTIIAPGRVRLAVGARSAAPNLWLRAPRYFGRMAEVMVMLGVTLFAVGSSLEPSTRQSGSITPRQTVILDAFYAHSPLGEIDYLRWLRLVRPDVSPSAADTTRLPMGGRFDGDPVEIQKGMGAAPR
jgi:hypothetical protein